ncbi:MAG: hypothetical protein ACI8P0_001015 [Planctomycetaceae bacterium]|jgi:hypothetical protein
MPPKTLFADWRRTIVRLVMVCHNALSGTDDLAATNDHECMTDE